MVFLVINSFDGSLLVLFVVVFFFILVFIIILFVFIDIVGLIVFEVFLLLFEFLIDC